MTQAQAPAGVPVIKIIKEDGSIKFNVKASVAIDGTFDKWDKFWSRVDDEGRKQLRRQFAERRNSDSPQVVS